MNASILQTASSVLTISPSRPWNLPGAEQAFEGGRRALRAGFHAHARTIFQALLPHEPQHPEVRLLLARTVFAQGNVSEAEGLLEGFDRRQASTPAVLVLRAECAFQRGDAKNGLSHTFRCVEAFPHDLPSRFLMARLQWLGGQESEAEVQFLSMAGPSDTGARACAWAVMCGWRQGQMLEVAELFESLRDDDAASEGLREFGHHAFDLPWIPSERVDPMARSGFADAWNDLFHRDHASTLAVPSFVGGRILV